MKVLVYSSNKGGVGKSSIALNVAGYLGLKRKVLYIGLDGQKNSSNVLRKETPTNTIYDVLNGSIDIKQAIYESNFKNVYYVPENRKLDNTSINRIALKELTEPIYRDFDYIVIDCPPQLSSIVYSAYALADEVIIPTELDRFSADNLVHVINTIKEINSNASICILPNKVVSNSKLHKEVKGELKSYVDTLDNVILGNSLSNSIEISNQMFGGKLLTLSNKFNKLKNQLKKHANEVR
ncbi:ParA family protein [Staphylococcus gallinarum]|uniref:ParA family protein n=1 Tax=Staphylococcus gallinarum TaxID=1293 RepID=UPI001E4C0D2B|nr:ParA family protein [Staphylococcus gallinarum]MCD8787449.1 ParA family protein [Staphylococcus gallinarum]MCD8845256.1 ParA family protein [Staphylococcus gallinarum]